MPVGRKSSIRRRFAANPAGGTAASGELIRETLGQLMQVSDEPDQPTGRSIIPLQPPRWTWPGLRVHYFPRPGTDLEA